MKRASSAIAAALAAALCTAVAAQQPQPSASDSKTTVKVIITGITSLTTLPAEGGAPLPPKLLTIHNGRGYGHLPVAMAGVDYQPTTSKARPLLKTANGRYQYVELRGDALEFDDVNAADQPLQYSEAEPPKGVLCPPSKERTSLYFLANLRRIIPKTDNADALTVDPDRLRVAQGKELVAGSMDLRFGTLSANVMSAVVWDFKQLPAKKSQARCSLGATYRQLLAQQAIWQFTIPRNTLVLSSTRAGKRTKLLELTAKNGVIELLLMNVTTVGTQNYTHATGRTVAEDPHFVHFYDRYKQYSAKASRQPRYIPVVAGVCGGEDGTDFKIDPCTLYQFADIPEPWHCQPPVLSDDTNCGPENGGGG